MIGKNCENIKVLPFAERYDKNSKFSFPFPEWKITYLMHFKLLTFGDHSHPLNGNKINQEFWYCGNLVINHYNLQYNPWKNGLVSFLEKENIFDCFRIPLFEFKSLSFLSAIWSTNITSWRYGTLAKHLRGYVHNSVNIIIAKNWRAKLWEYLSRQLGASKFTSASSDSLYNNNLHESGLEDQHYGRRPQNSGALLYARKML